MAASKKRTRESTVEPKQVSLAVPALFSYVTKKKADAPKKAMFDEAQFVWMLMSLKHVPNPEKKPRLLLLPNPLYEEGEVCVFSKQPGKEVRDLLKARGVENITKVISLNKLRKNYKSYEEKRKLCASYERFLCDDKIYHLLPQVLGKTFFGKKKQPTPVNLQKSSIKSVIDKTLASTTLELGQGPCSAIKIGHTHQEIDAVEENILACCTQIAKCVPRGWQNVQSLHIKTSDSISLPIYNSLPNATQKIEPDIKKQKLKS